MSNDEIKGHIVTLWIIAGIVIFVGNMHSLSTSDLAERVEALEQAQTSEAQR